MFRILGLAAAVVLTAACEGKSGSQVTPGNEIPVISALDPAFALAGDPAFTLRVSGAGFDMRSTIRFDGSDRATRLVSPSPGAFALETAVLSGEIATPTSIVVTVFNPSPGGGTSNPVTFHVFDPDDVSPVPELISVSPTTVHTGADAALTLHGRDFVSTSKVIWTRVGASTGVTLTPSSVSATEINVIVPAAQIGAAGSAFVEVENPPPGGGISNVLAVPVF